MDSDPAYAAEVGRLALDEFGYDKIISLAVQAGWVRYVRRNSANALGQQAASAGFWAIFTEYAVTAGVIASADSPAPGPADIVALGVLAIGLVDAGFGDHTLVSIPKRARGDAAPALPAAGMMASATAAPTTRAAPRAPVMPADLSEADQNLWRKCNQLHQDYKATQKKAGSYGPQMDPLKNEIMNNRGSAQDRATFCALLEERIKLVQREKDERSTYIQNDCDRFDWFEEGNPAAERLAAHQKALKQVIRELDNLQDVKDRVCK